MHAEGAGSDPRTGAAADRAKDVVGLYGDPDSTWGIGLELRVADPPTPIDVRERMADLLSRHPHLGDDVLVDASSPEQWQALRADLLCRDYAPGEPLVRIGLQQDQARVLVAAHHGVCDGLGLVALGSAATGSTIRTRARGIGERRSPRGFWRHSAGRIAEALLRPPPRFPGAAPRGATSDPHERDSLVVVHELAPLSLGTADVAWAVAQVFAARGGSHTPLVIIGASRRATEVPSPDRSTAYFRLRVPPQATPVEVKQRLADLDPEPDFPETDLGGIGPAVVRVLRRRLGATAVLSNLGVLEAPGLLSAAMFPARSGPRAVVVGLATTDASTTLTLRTRSSDFDQDLAERILTDLVDAMRRSRQ